MKPTSVGTLIIGHRGCAQDAPENTLAAVNLGWEQQADAVEIDVYLSRDGVVVVHHDETTRKTAGVEVPIVKQTLVELKRHDVGRWKHPRFAGERIPTLREVLATVGPGRRLLIEVKCGSEAVEPILADLAASGVPENRIVVISFDPNVVAASKQAAPRVEAALVAEVHQDAAGGFSPRLETLRDEALRLGADAVDLGYAPPLSKDDVALFHRAGLKVYIWTANETERARQLRDAGVDGLTTDRPGSLRQDLTPS